MGRVNEETCFDGTFGMEGLSARGRTIDVLGFQH